MASDISSKYKETRERLIEGINNYDVEVRDSTAFFNRCYFCQTRIAYSTPMKVIYEPFETSRGKRGMTIYTSHPKCYRALLCGIR